MYDMIFKNRILKVLMLVRARGPFVWCQNPIAQISKPALWTLETSPSSLTSAAAALPTALLFSTELRFVWLWFCVDFTSHVWIGSDPSSAGSDVFLQFSQGLISLLVLLTDSGICFVFRIFRYRGGYQGLTTRFIRYVMPFWECFVFVWLVI